MRYWLERHSEAVQVGAALTLLFLLLLSLQSFRAQRPEVSPIVIHPITPQPSATMRPTATPGPVTVYVSGAVARPGVYSLPWYSRVQEALVAAGEATTDADLVRVNLAQRVCDEQQIYVPHKSEEVIPVLPTPRPTALNPGGLPPSDQPININAADAVQLEALPGIGPVLAQRIIEWREAHGPFTGIEDIKKVRGIGDATYERILDMITVR